MERSARSSAPFETDPTDLTILQLVLTTPEQVVTFYKSDGTQHSKRKDIGFGDYFGRLLGQCVGVLSGQDWTRLRKIFDPVRSSQVAPHAS